MDFPLFTLPAQVSSLDDPSASRGACPDRSHTAGQRLSVAPRWMPHLPNGYCRASCTPCRVYPPQPRDGEQACGLLERKSVVTMSSNQVRSRMAALPDALGYLRRSPNTITRSAGSHDLLFTHRSAILAQRSSRLTLPPVSRLQSDSPLRASSLHSFGIHPGRGAPAAREAPFGTAYPLLPARDPSMARTIASRRLSSGW